MFVNKVVLKFSMNLTFEFLTPDDILEYVLLTIL